MQTLEAIWGDLDSIIVPLHAILALGGKQIGRPVGPDALRDQLPRSPGGEQTYADYLLFVKECLSVRLSLD